MMLVTMMSQRWLKQVLENAIKFRSLPHMEIVLDEMDPNGSGEVFTDHPRLMSAVFRSRCASILPLCARSVPRLCAATMPNLTPWPFLKEYHWPFGARFACGKPVLNAKAVCQQNTPEF